MSTHNGENTNRIIEERNAAHVSRAMTQLADCTRHTQQVLATGSRAEVEQALRLWEKARDDTNRAIGGYRKYFDLGMEEWLQSGKS